MFELLGGCLLSLSLLRVLLDPHPAPRPRHQDSLTPRPHRRRYTKPLPPSSSSSSPTESPISLSLSLSRCAMDAPSSCQRTEFDRLSSPCAGNSSSASTISVVYDDEDQCRICRTGNEVDMLISPCDCKGSIQFVHPQCLVKWITYTGRTSQSPSQNKRCELCGMAYQLVWSARPWRRWRLPQLNHSERLRLHVFTFSYLLAAIGTSSSVCLS